MTAPEAINRLVTVRVVTVRSVIVRVAIDRLVIVHVGSARSVTARVVSARSAIVRVAISHLVIVRVATARLVTVPAAATVIVRRLAIGHRVNARSSAASGPRVVSVYRTANARGVTRHERRVSTVRRMD